MSTKAKTTDSIKAACLELENALGLFKSIKDTQKNLDEERLEEMRKSLEIVKKQLEEFK